jgi:nucleoside-diphosphate-sugar epimerase
LIFASSSEAYGSLADNGNCEEPRLLYEVPDFFNEYSLTKWAGEKQIDIARINSGLRAISLRFFNVYGEEPYSPYRSVVCRFIYSLLHRQRITVFDGTRDFIYISDWAHAVANAADRFDDLKCQAYNIGGDRAFEISHLAAIIATACGLAADDPMIKYLGSPEPSNITKKFPNIELAKRDLGLDPKIGLVEGIGKTVEWMRHKYSNSITL